MRVRGTCHVILAYELGFAIDLSRAEALLGAAPRPFKRPRRVPEAARLRNPPLALTQISRPVELTGHRTDEAVSVLVWDLGALSLSYSIPIDGTLDDLVTLSDALWGHEGLFADARQRARELAAAMAGAIERPAFSEPVEDYVIFEIQRTDGTPAAALWEEHGSTVARILRGDPAALSDQEITDALSHRSAYVPDEVVLVDWYAAVLYGDDMVDERFVLEFCVVELLELRILDAQLDRDIDAAHDLLRRHRSWWRSLRTLGADSERLSQLAADRMVLFEGIDTGLKLLGDQYLARLYRLASGRFHLPQWDETIERKLAVVSGIYEKLDRQTGSRRFELLEVIIIVLIAVSTIAPFLPALTR